ACRSSRPVNGLAMDLYRGFDLHRYSYRVGIDRPRRRISLATISHNRLLVCCVLGLNGINIHASYSCCVSFFLCGDECCTTESILFDQKLRAFSPGVTEFLENNYEPVGTGVIWRRKRVSQASTSN